MSEMRCSIDWTLSPEAYVSYFDDAPYSTLLQDYTYGLVMAKLNYQTLRHGLILMDGKRAGVVQLLEAKLFGTLIHAAILDRGPVWFEGFGSDAHIKAFFQEFNRQFPKRLGRKRRIIPESNINLAEHGFTRNVHVQPYQTYWLDIDTAEDLKAGMKKNWRNSLSKAQRDFDKGDGAIEYDTKGKFLPWLLQAYSQHQQDKAYGGADVKTLRPLLEAFADKENCLMTVYQKEGKAIAAACFLVHGQSATYQIGWTSKTGRNLQAQYIVLWESIAQLRRRGGRNLDLGGANDESAKGVKSFKEGLGGRHVELSGQYS